VKVDEELVMALPRKLVETTILGLQDPINEHLVKLVGFELPDEQREHFRRELRTWFRKLRRLRIKPNNRPGSVKFYFDLLFDYPFGGVEVENMRSIIDEISQDYDASPTKSAEDLVAWLRGFHEELAGRLHNREDVLDLIPE
jgi:hypothetical protein